MIRIILNIYPSVDSPLSILLYIIVDIVSNLTGRPRKAGTPKDPKLFEIISINADKIAGNTSGKVILRIVFILLAPSIPADSSKLLLIVESADPTNKYENT